MTPEIDALFTRFPQPLIQFGTDSDELKEARDLVAKAVASADGDPWTQAGLWLYVGDFDRAHPYCQLDEEATAAWHAIVHRWEADYGNARYWHRRAGTSDELTRLTERTGRTAHVIELATREWIDYWRARHAPSAS
jgi:hypothetical protein